ncbi:DNA polymerase III subunit gamma/tau [Neisseria meningitidis]|nr:DNA polymerase III subunit gamma/tau [Neisseria meningitidis]
MAYQVLARKWRPKTFADLVGQEHVVKALQNALDEGRLHHAYLLTGTRGVGKTTIARILAKSLNCENAQHGEPCGVCESCTQIDAGRYVDLLEIDAASNTGIDNIREVLENAQYAPTAGKYKVYIIDEVHMLSKSAFNAMLKTLEEPPEHVKFILATTDPHKVPVTVLSRCLQFVLRNMTSQQVADHLAYVLDSEKIAYEPPALQLLGRAAAGSMRDALSLLDQAIAMGSGSVAEQDVRQMIGAVDKQYLYELLTGIINQDGEALLAKAQEMAACAVGFDNALGELAMLLQHLALIQAVPSALAHDDPDRGVLLPLSQTLSGEQIQLYYQCAIRGKQDLSLAPDEYAGFVMTLLRMLAFTPLAATSCEANAVIENTELKSPSAQTAEKEAAAKKPLPSKAETAQTSVQTASVPAMPSEDKVTESASAQGNNDVPPWEDVPNDAETVSDVPVQELAESIQTSSETTEANRPSANKAETSANNQVSKNKATDNETGASLSEVPSENLIQTTPNDEAVETEAFVHEAPAEPFYDYGFPDDGYPVEDSAKMPPPPDWEYAVPADAEEEEAEEENNDDEGSNDEDGTQFAPPPEFSTENWAAIVRHFARKLGAAQMLAQHSAWTEYHPDTGLMVLAMTAEARATADKKRLDKIRDTLAQAYGLQLTLQTQDWRDEAGRETPAMQDKRVQAEDRQKAQALLEADPAAQKILQAFGAQWQPESLELAANRP